MSAEVQKKAIEVRYQGMSIAEASTASVSEGQFMNYSISAGFTPLRALDPGETTAATIARALATLIMDLNKKNDT